MSSWTALHQTDVAANVSPVWMRHGIGYYPHAVTEDMTDVKERLIMIYSLKVQLATSARKTWQQEEYEGPGSTTAAARKQR